MSESSGYLLFCFVSIFFTLFLALVSFHELCYRNEKHGGQAACSCWQRLQCHIPVALTKAVALLVPGYSSATV